ncbi:MAG: hypothetical protein CMI79_06715 [Candidatus Pelagibacter sp.]|nr:hypothetical protein [Candidatus Pelagibacter sp.]
MSFSSQDNKRLLWGLMADSNVFAGIDDTKVEEVKQLFEKEIIDISNAPESLLDKNKKILTSMSTKLNYLRTSNITQQSSEEAPSRVTSKELAEERSEKMQNKFQNKQQEFNKLISEEKPKGIDFSDNSEEKPIGSEMDNLLANIMEKRSKQLNQVMQDQDTNAAEKWISNNGAGSDINPEPLILNIGEKIEKPSITFVNTPPNVKDKRVTFSEDSKEENSLDLIQFLSSKSNSNSSQEDPAFLSPKENVKDQIMKIITKIEQDLIEIKEKLKDM